MANLPVPDSDLGAHFMSALFETPRMLRQLADKEARKFGMTRAQWAVLSQVQKNEGHKQADLADAMEMAPISLTRLIDRLCDSGLLERRNDDTDRRIKRLYLTEAAKPLMAQLMVAKNELIQIALEGLSEADRRRLVGDLETIKSNIRAAMTPAAAKTKDQSKERAYG